jgi:hypothetical protein
MTAYSTSVNALTGSKFDAANKNRRGLNVYTINEVIGIAGHGRNGEIVQGTVEQPLLSLSMYDRFQIFQKCDPVFGCVTSRANRISALDWRVIKETKNEDRIAENMKQSAQLWKEYNGTIQGLVVCPRMYGQIKVHMPDLFPDFSNFQSALMRWKRRINSDREDKATEIEDWLNEPNQEDNFSDFLKKWVSDLMVHGTFSTYKETNKNSNLLENFYALPGGVTVPLRNRYVGGPTMFAQVVPGEDPKIYFGDEIMFDRYMPNTAIAYGMIPLEALVNKIAESLFFDVNAAQRADGTTAPEKVVLFGENSPFGDGGLTGGPDYSIPINKDEQSKLETVLNEPRKNAVKVLSGYGTPLVLDMSRADTFGTQAERQKFIRECVGFVFNLSNMEMNLTGSDGTSGRSTSEAQSDIDKEKGIYPIVKSIATKLNREVIPARFGSGYTFEFSGGTSDAEQLDLDIKKMNSRTYSLNEIRTDRGDDPFQGEQYDLPDSGGPAPDGSAESPLAVRSI